MTSPLHRRETVIQFLTHNMSYDEACCLHSNLFPEIFQGKHPPTPTTTTTTTNPHHHHPHPPADVQWYIKALCEISPPWCYTGRWPKQGRQRIPLYIDHSDNLSLISNVCSWGTPRFGKPQVWYCQRNSQADFYHGSNWSGAWITKTFSGWNPC